MLRRVPLESDEPLVALAWARVALVAAGLAATPFGHFQFEGKLVLMLGAVGLPWALTTVYLARTRPESAFSPVMPAIDIGVIVLIEIVVPSTYAAQGFVALFFISVHAHLQGPARGLLIAACGASSLILVSVFTDGPVGGGLLGFYNSIFFVAAVGSAFLIGGMRTSESAGRLRARDLTRRTLGAEAEARRRLAESIHDGPLQELIGLDMMLAASRQASDSDDRTKSDELLGTARELVERNVERLRDEIVGLGPGAFEELSFEEAARACLPAWQRRFGIDVELDAERVELSSEMAGDLFRIAQEAVTNAGRHAGAERISVELRRVGSEVELRVVDDGAGFGSMDPLGPAEPGHLGLAAMRERTTLLYGELRIESSDAGTALIVRAPVAANRAPTG